MTEYGRTRSPRGLFGDPVRRRKWRSAPTSALRTTQSIERRAHASVVRLLSRQHHSRWSLPRDRAKNPTKCVGERGTQDCRDLKGVLITAIVTAQKRLRKSDCVLLAIGCTASSREHDYGAGVRSLCLKLQDIPRFQSLITRSMRRHSRRAGLLLLVLTCAAAVLQSAAQQHVAVVGGRDLAAQSRKLQTVLAIAKDQQDKW